MTDELTPSGALIAHLTRHALRTDGPFTLRSGETSAWYVDARQTTFDGGGAAVVGACVLDMLDPRVTAAGGMTMGADPIAVATAIAAYRAGRPLRAFSVRKAAKSHGTGGRLVGPVAAGDSVAVLEDTTTTGSALVEAIGVLLDEGFEVVQAIALIDRSGHAAARRIAELGVRFAAVATPSDLGVAP